MRYFPTNLEPVGDKDQKEITWNSDNGAFNNN